MRLGLLALIVLSCGTLATQAADWAYQGGDAGMTKYSPDNVPDGLFQQVYSKRFYSKYSADNMYNATYNYATNVMIRGGQTWILSNDRPDDGNWYSPIQNTRFDWLTGATTTHTGMPTYSSGTHSFHASEANPEIDSHHTNFPAVWATDGRIYARRGGDHAVNGAMDVSSGIWTLLPYGGAANSTWLGDSAAFINVYGDKLLYYGGDTRDPWNYAAANISASAWAGGTPGTLSFPLYIDSPSGSGDFYAGLRHGDFPKAGSNMAVIASWSTTGVASSSKMYVTATNLATGQKAWTRNFANDDVGATGFYTSTSDYWRFLATEDGKYAFYVRNGGQTQLHIANITTGADIVTQALAANSDPIMGYNQNFLYVVSATQQLKINATTGAIAWQTANSFSSDAGYYANYEDPLYRPMVLTNDTMWFIDGSTMGNGHLIGMRTSDGTVIQNVDLAALVTGKNANERLMSVNDLVESNGQLGVLLDIGDVTDPYYGTTNKIKYQDLYTFSSVIPGDANRDGKVTFSDYIDLELGFGTSGGWSAGDFNGDGIVNFKDYIILEANFNKGVPEPATMSLLVLGALAMLKRRK